jgi:hypothetical protein
MDPAEYCREVETYLCRKNEGHLIRIVGPVFEQVCGWAAQGVPLAVVYRGIDQYCERYYAKGPRRRPVRVEFCEADVLSLFDDWRRAVGVSNLGADHEEEEAPRKPDSLPAHLDRAIAKLTALRSSGRSEAFDRVLDAAVRELDRVRASAKSARGDARSAILARLAALDAELLGAARDQLSDADRVELSARAEAEIAPFASRMPADAQRTAVEAAFARLLRDSLGLPTLSLG